MRKEARAGNTGETRELCEGTRVLCRVERKKPEFPLQAGRVVPLCAFPRSLRQPSFLPRESLPPGPRSWTCTVRDSSYGHLAIRFFRSLRPGGPSASSLAWAENLLDAGEWKLFCEMPGFDQRHCLGVGRGAHRITGSELVGRAGLLHDVGKVDCGLSPFGRSFATVGKRLFPVTAARWTWLWWERVRAAPTDRLVPSSWQERFSAYWAHPWTGRRMLEAVGAHPVVAAWAEHHHQIYVPEGIFFSWEQAVALWDCDND